MEDICRTACTHAYTETQNCSYYHPQCTITHSFKRKLRFSTDGAWSLPNCTTSGAVRSMVIFFYIIPCRGAMYCDQRVCLPVCLSVCLSVCLHVCLSARVSQKNLSKPYRIFCVSCLRRLDVEESLT